MKHISNIKIILIFSFSLLSIMACSNEKKINTEMNTAKTNSSDTLIFSFSGAAVGPQYYRSYIIRVTPGQVYYAISDYSKILSEDVIKLSKDSYESFEKAINGLQLKNRNEVGNVGCTGGHSEDLDLYPGSSKELKGHTYFCGGKQYGDLAGDVLTAGNLFKAMVPDLAGKIEATKQNN
jgi:hypothetical protein